jgi:hypothetical protein
LIYRDLNAEAVAKTGSVNAFRLPWLIFYVVVIFSAPVAIKSLAPATEQSKLQ